MSRQSKAAKGKKRKPKKKTLWGLEPRTFGRSVRNYIDQDYSKQLSREEKEWLSQFNEEFYGNSVKSDGLHLKKLKNYDKRKRRYKLAKKREMKRIYDTTNARNRDIHTAFYKIYDKPADNFHGDNYPTQMPKNHLSLFDLNRELSYNNIESTHVEYIDYIRLVEKYLKVGLTEEEAKAKAQRDLENEY